MKEILKQLCAKNGVPGYEDEVRECIRQMVEPYADEIIEDHLGNLLVLKKGKQPRKAPMMVCAHMDEVGFLISRITSDGMFKIVPSGGIDPRVLVGRRMEVGLQKVPGVISLKAIHLTTPEERKVAPGIDTLYIDIGASSQKEAEQYARVGDYATFDSRWVEFGEDRIKSKAIDDRIGCAVMVELIKEGVEKDTWFAFVVGEEIGSRGAQAAASRIKPRWGLVIEGTTAADIPGVREHERSCFQGGGAVVSLADRGSVYNREFVRRLTGKADEAGIRWQYRASMNGSTDAGVMHQAGEGAQVFGLAAPVRYIHSASNVLHWPDAEEVLKMARLVVKEAECDD